MAHPHHHQHLRKRSSKNHSPFPHDVKWKKVLDYIVIFLGILNVPATLPQVAEIWINKQAAGVSAISWTYYSLYSLVFVVYGVVHKEKPIVMTYFINFFLYCAVAIGAIKYG